MDLESSQHNHSGSKPFTNLSAKPTNFYQNQSNVFVPLADYTLSIFDIGKSTFTRFAQNLHEKRINCVRESNNVLITGSNDFTVRLWDRASGKLIHKFQKPGSEFNVLDLSQHILCAAHTSKLVFWDIRKMKQRAQFHDSFNGQITSLKFNLSAPKCFMACSVDGMISKFDLTQPNQQQAFMWCTKVLQSPSKLQLINNMTLVETTNHIMYLLQEQDLKKKIVVNDFEEPKHVVGSKLMLKNGNYDMEYFSWNLEKQLVEKWQNDKVVGYVQNVEDVQFWVPLSGDNVMYMAENGQAYLKTVKAQLQKPKYNHKEEDMVKNKEGPLGKHKEELMGKHNQLVNGYSKSQKFTNKWQKIQQQGPANQNGFILKRPASFKSNTKKFKPY